MYNLKMGYLSCLWQKGNFYELLQLQIEKFLKKSQAAGPLYFKLRHTPWLVGAGS
jgi:hypothetical protein